MKEYNTKPIPGEDRYVDYDNETGLWCVFGLDSGFAYSSDATEEAANRRLVKSKEA